MGMVSIIESIVMSLVIVGCGYMCKIVANEKISDGIGYRTKLSKKNPDTWREANIYGGKVFMICGLIYLICSLIFSLIFFNDEAIASIGVAFGILPVSLIGIYVSERHLRSIFDNEGNRKEKHKKD